MTLLAHINALVAIVSAGIVHGTDVLCGLVGCRGAAAQRGEHLAVVGVGNLIFPVGRTPARDRIPAFPRWRCVTPRHRSVRTPDVRTDTARYRGGPGIRSGMCAGRFTNTAFPLDTPCLPLAASIRPAVSPGATKGSPRRATG